MIRSPLRFEVWVGVLGALLAVACRGDRARPPTAAARSVPSASAPTPPPVDLGEVLDYARRAGAVYGDEAAIRAVVGPSVALTVADVPGADVRVFVELDEAKKVQWVAVRGTANLQNVAVDTEYAKVYAPDLGIPIHEGFVEDARAVWSFTRPRLRPGVETRLTGHSLGGALAVLLAMRLRVDGQPLGRVVTFGQPKVTTEEGVARFRGLPLLRVVNHDDPVPLLPWETPGAVVGGLYRHFGEELRLTDRGTYQLFPERPAESYLLTSFAEHLGRENPKEHEIARYLGRLQAVLGLSGRTGGSR